MYFLGVLENPKYCQVYFNQTFLPIAKLISF